MNSYQLLSSGTILDFASACNITTTAMIVGTYFPEDIPEKDEGMLIVIATIDRKTVLFLSYNTPQQKVYSRDIISDRWLADWKKVLPDDNLGNSYLLSGGKKIVMNSDLNTLISIGNYYCEENIIVPTLINKPNISEAFTMKVEYATGTAYTCQTIRVFTTGHKFYRMQDNIVGWNSWRQLY